MDYERFVILVRLSRMGEVEPSFTFSKGDMDEAIDRALAARLADGWEQDGLVRRDGPSAEIPVRRPGGGEAGAAQHSALARHVLGPREADDGGASSL